MNIRGGMITRRLSTFQTEGGRDKENDVSLPEYAVEGFRTYAQSFWGGTTLILCVLSYGCLHLERPVLKISRGCRD